MVESAKLIKAGNRPPFPMKSEEEEEESPEHEKKLKILVEQCWQDDSHSRPSWNSILLALREIQLDYVKGIKTN